MDQEKINTGLSSNAANILSADEETSFSSQNKAELKDRSASISNPTDSELDKFQKPRRSDQLWNFYKLVLVFPAGSTGFQRKIGMLLYVICIIMSAVSIAFMTSQSSRYYTETSIINIEDNFRVQFPDILACPSPYLLPKMYNFTVFYNHERIRTLKVPPSLVNELTKAKYDACENKNVCPELMEPCAGKYRNACGQMNLTLWNHIPRNFWQENVSINEVLEQAISPDPKLAIFLLLKGNKMQYNLEMLWLYLLEPQPYVFPRRFRAYSSEEDFYCRLGYQVCNESIETFWIHEKLCFLQPGFNSIKDHLSFQPPDNTPSNEAVLYDYFFGNIQVQELSKFFPTAHSFQTHENYSVRIPGGIMYKFRIIETDDFLKPNEYLVSQPEVRGINIFGIRNSSRIYKIIYELTTRWVWYRNAAYWPRISLSYDHTHQISKKPVLTSYSHFQLAVSLFSCFVGHSVVQLVYLGTERIPIVRNAWKHFKKLFSILTFIILCLLTAVIGYLDTSFYIDNRFNVITKEKSHFPIPMLDFHTMFPSPTHMNVTKMRQYNVSLELYAYMKFIAFRETDIKIVIPNIRPVNSNISDHSEFVSMYEACNVGTKNAFIYSARLTQANLKHSVGELLKTFSIQPLPYGIQIKELDNIRKEARDLSKVLGYKREMTFVDYFKEFSLDINLYMDCRIGNTIFDCGKYASYSLGIQRGTAIAFDFPSNLSESEHHMVGIAGSLRISIDISAYKKDSEFNFYYLPCLEKRVNLIWDDLDCDRKFLRTLSCHFPFEPQMIVAGKYQVNLDFQVLLSPRSFVYPIEVSYREKLTANSHNDCAPKESLICDNPIKRFQEVFNSVWLDNWCECMFCSPEMAETAQIKSAQWISGRSTECCTFNILTECYTRHRFTKLDDGTHTPNNTAKHIFRDWIRVNGDLSRVPHIRNYSKADRAVLNDKKGFLDLKDEVQDRLLHFTRRCFAKPCLTFTYDVPRHYEMAPRKNFIDYTFFFKTEKFEGLAEVDRYQPEQMLGVLMCSYSFTFGIGLVGIFELCLSLLASFGENSKIAAQLLKLHFLKNMIVASNAQSKRVAPLPATNITKVRPYPHNDSNSNQGDKFETNARGKPLFFSRAATHIPFRSKLILYLKRTRGYMMILALTLFTVGLGITTSRFFESMEDFEYIEDIVRAPMIRPPSIALCSNNATNAQVLFDNLGNDICETRNEARNCREVFSIYLSGIKDQFCFIYDNSRAPRVKFNDNGTELFMKIPNDSIAHESIFYSLVQWSRMTPTTLFPFYKWTKWSVIVKYGARVKRFENGCQNKFPPGLLPRCKEKFLEEKHPYFCSIRDNMTLAPLEKELLCEHYQYFIGHSLHRNIKENGAWKAYLAVEQAGNHALVTTVRPKFDFLTIFTIVGGFVGTFIELTVLNCFALVFLCLSYLYTSLKHLLCGVCF